MSGNILKTSALLLLFTTISISKSFAQNSKKEKDSLRVVAVTNMITEKDYVFHAEYALPMKGGRKYLSAGYTISVTKDTINSDLPYFGRVYQASLSSDGGLRFNLTDFDYKVSDRKKGGWDISIKSKNHGNVQELSFTIFDNGSASLIVTSSDRQPITFDGTIEKRKPKK